MLLLEFVVCVMCVYLFLLVCLLCFFVLLCAIVVFGVCFGHLFISCVFVFRFRCCFRCAAVVVAALVIADSVRRVLKLYDYYDALCVVVLSTQRCLCVCCDTVLRCSVFVYVCFHVCVHAVNKIVYSY